MTDVVVLSLEPWDEVWRRNQHLVAGLLRTDPELRVLFVEPAVDPLHDLLGRRVPQAGHGVRPLALSGAEGRLWSFRPAKLLPRKVDPSTDRRLASATVRAARRLGFADPVLWINDPGGAEVLRQTGWPALYDITDDWLEADRPSAEHERLVRDEDLLMERCAEVVVCSPTLAASKGRIRPVTLIPNAVDVEFYRQPQPRPADLPDGPVALYLGTIHTDRIDVDLCVSTARDLGENGTLVLVGPHPLAADDLQRLRAAGVLLMGAKPAAEVPGYLQHADVLLVPHVVTPFTMSLDPIKRYEYAAVGRRVVSTPVTGFVDADDPCVTVASGEDFVARVRAAMSRRPPPPADPQRGTATWANRAEEMTGVLGRVGASTRTAGAAPLTVVVDVLSAPADSGGMRRYAEELIHAWFDTDEGRRDSLIVHGEPWIEKAFADLERVRTVTVPDPTQFRRLTRQWLKSAMLWRRLRADALLSLGPMATPLVPGRARVCVVHDWRHIAHPEEFGRATRWYRRLWWLSVATCTTVVAVSDKTRAETLRLVPRAHVVTVLNGTDHPRRWQLPPPDGDESWVLTYGHHSNKRPDLVLRAFALAEAPQAMHLVVLGARGEDAERLTALASELGVGDRVRLPGFVPELEYQRLVARASLIVLASTDEGYGLPVVEGHYFGTPVVTTDDSGLGGIHGDGVVSVPPTPDALATAIRESLGAPRRVTHGLTWVDTARAVRTLLPANPTMRDR